MQSKWTIIGIATAMTSLTFAFLTFLAAQKWWPHQIIDFPLLVGACSIPSCVIATYIAITKPSRRQAIIGACISASIVGAFCFLFYFLFKPGSDPFKFGVALIFVGLPLGFIGGFVPGLIAGLIGISLFRAGDV